MPAGTSSIFYVDQGASALRALPAPLVLVGIEAAVLTIATSLIPDSRQGPTLLLLGDDHFDVRFRESGKRARKTDMERKADIC